MTVYFRHNYYHDGDEFVWFSLQHMVPVIGSETLQVGPLLVGILLATEGWARPWS
ncbi:MAG: hypothetical protein CM1200mP39_30340 [Dehalococcoidia bacterium]|nr:MAG: hypothetical protein CM1200mP39_30340 [Dehalococcoidia bacterium]